MSGERRQWFQLALILKTPLQELMRKTTSSEFAEWNRVLQDDMNTQGKQEHYLAQIAYEIRCSQAKHPRRVKFDWFLMKFKADRDRLTTRGIKDPKAKMQQSKKLWAMAVGAQLPEEKG